MAPEILKGSPYNIKADAYRLTKINYFLKIFLWHTNCELHL